MTVCLRVNSTFKGSRDTRRKISSCHFKVKNRASSNLKSLLGETLAGSTVSKREDLTRAAFRLPLSPSACNAMALGLNLPPKFAGPDFTPIL